VLRIVSASSGEVKLIFEDILTNAVRPHGRLAALSTSAPTSEAVDRLARQNARGNGRSSLRFNSIGIEDRAMTTMFVRHTVTDYKTWRKGL